ncbi:hypothetical protein ABZS63_32735, partial [Streptomyces sp. NPDC005568]
RRGAEDRLLPGYGWIFGMGDGTSNVGLGVLNTLAAWGIAHRPHHSAPRPPWATRTRQTVG